MQPHRERSAGAVARAVVVAASVYAATGVLTVLAVQFGVSTLSRQPHAFQMISEPRGDYAPSLLRAATAWDGVWYSWILRSGYAYHPDLPSSTQFFPAFPLTGRAVAESTGARPKVALLIVAHCSLLGSFLLLHLYIARRWPESPVRVAWLVVLGFAVWPTTVFLRMAYSESLFLLAVLVAMYGMECGWRPASIAFVAGFATGTRGVGIALLAPLAVYLWQQSQNSWRFVAKAAVLLPLAAWGLAAYIIFQWLEFGEPLAFAKTQNHWVVRPAVHWEVFPQMLALEPLWTVYDPKSPAYWGRGELVSSPLLSLQFANPIYFVAAVALVGVGVWQGWLNSREWSLSALLLAIPYFSLGYTNCMWSQGRFVAVVFTIYMVLGRLLAKLHWAVAGAPLALSAGLLATYAALFACWYRIF